MSTRRLEALFAPASVAVVGASDRDGSAGGRIARHLAGSFGGRLYGVNPRRPALAGVEMRGDVSELPGDVDLAIVATPSSTLPEVAAGLAARGVKTAVVVSDPKRGPERGADVRASLRRVVAETGMRIVGPNALGLSVPPSLFAMLPPVRAQSGQIAFVGQSATAAAPLIEWAGTQALGFSAVVSLGDMVDVDYGDMIDWFAEDRRTRVIALFIERLGDPRKLLSAARQAARTKPVIVIKPGAPGDPPEREAAFDAAFRRAGMLRAGSLDDLYAVLEAVAARLPADAQPAHGSRLAILTNGESLGALALDAMRGTDATLARLSPETAARIDAAMPPGRPRANPADVLPDADPARYAAAFEALAEDRGVDAILALYGPNGVASPRAMADAAIGRVMAMRARPGRRWPFVMAAWTGGAESAEARHLLAERHIAAFETPTGAVKAFGALVALRAAQARLAETPEFVETADRADIDDANARLERDARAGPAPLSPDSAAAVARLLRIEPGGGGDGALIWRVEIKLDPDFGPVLRFGPGGPHGRFADPPPAELPPLNAAAARDLLMRCAPARRAREAGAIGEASLAALGALIVRASELVADCPAIVALAVDGVTADGARAYAPAPEGVVAPPSGDPNARFAIRPYPREMAGTVEGTDGTRYRIRPIRAEDEGLLQAFGRRLSADDLRLRFFQPLREFSHDLAVRLTQIDYARDMAFVLQPADDDAFLGVVRLHRGGHADEGEFAVTVRSDLQGKGLGRLLMERIVAYARERGLAAIFGVVMAENSGMLRLARKLGFKAESEPGEPTIVRVTLRLKPS